MLVSVYIRKEDEDKWRKLPKKTEAIHAMLNGQKLSAVRIEETVADVPKIRPLTEVIEEEVYDPYKNLILDVTGNSGVWDTLTEEQVPADKEMVDELKKRKQTR